MLLPLAVMQEPVVKESCVVAPLAPLDPLEPEVPLAVLAEDDEAALLEELALCPAIIAPAITKAMTEIQTPARRSSGRPGGMGWARGTSKGSKGGRGSAIDEMVLNVPRLWSTYPIFAKNAMMPHQPLMRVSF